MLTYSLDDALDCLIGMDNELHDGLEPVAKVAISQKGSELTVALTPYDEDGNADATRTETFIGTFRRA